MPDRAFLESHDVILEKKHYERIILESANSAKGFMPDGNTTRALVCDDDHATLLPHIADASDLSMVSQLTLTTPTHVPSLGQWLAQKPQKWEAAYQDETRAFEHCGVYKVVSRPRRKNVVG